MGKVSVVLLAMFCICLLAKAKDNEYAPKISFKDVIESQVGVVKKVIDLNQEVKALEQKITSLQNQQKALKVELTNLESKNQKKSSANIQNEISVPSDYQNLINQAKSWAK